MNVIARGVVALATLVVAGSVGIAHGAVPAQSTATAVVIVDTGSGTHQSVIHFEGAVTGLEALQLAGAAPVTINFGSLGAAVCQLYGVGDAPVPSQCPGGWTYFRAVGGAGAWTQSGSGASNTLVHDGDVEGWKYGGGRPPFASFCDVVGCAPPATQPPPAATAAPTPVETPAPAGPVATAAPSGTNGSEASPKTDDQPATSTGGATKGAGSTSPTSTTGNAKEQGGSTRSRRASNVEIAAGPGTGGNDSGSPTGVIVAGAVLLIGTGAAVWFRRRRQGPAPG